MTVHRHKHTRRWRATNTSCPPHTLSGCVSKDWLQSVLQCFLDESFIQQIFWHEERLYWLSEWSRQNNGEETTQLYEQDTNTSLFFTYYQLARTMRGKKSSLSFLPPPPFFFLIPSFSNRWDSSLLQNICAPLCLNVFLWGHPHLNLQPGHFDWPHRHTNGQALQQKREDGKCFNTACNILWQKGRS